MSDPSTPPADLPTPEIRQGRGIGPSLIWIVPLIAALVGLVLIVRAYQSSGPTITISFETAEGLEAGKTEVRYKNVVIGKVRNIKLGEDRQHVIVKVDLSKEAEELAVEDTRFWVVRPRADLGGISGLNTLLSGAFVSVDVGISTESASEFTGLEVPPAITHDQRGKRFVLTSPELGSLSIGSPIYFRRIPVGRIVGVSLNPDGKGVEMRAFVDEPYDRFVTENVRFWNASGVAVSIDASGIKVNTQSLITLLAGGVTFQPPDGQPPGAPVHMDSEFPLYADETSALAPPEGSVIQVRMRFAQSLRGLAVGAAVDFRGLEIGKVKGIAPDYDQQQKQFSGVVTAELYPQRLGQAYQKLRQSEASDARAPETLMRNLVAKGLRAQLRTGNLLTGNLYIALDFPAKPKPVAVDPNQHPLEIPTESGSLDQIQSQIADIVTKLDEIPFGEIGSNLRDTLKSADSLMQRLDKELAPEAKKTLEELHTTLDSLNQNLAAPDSGLQQDAHKTLDELNRAARALRNLSEYLQRHPESLARGRPDSADTETAP